MIHYIVVKLVKINDRLFRPFEEFTFNELGWVITQEGNKIRVDLGMINMLSDRKTIVQKRNTSHQEVMNLILSDKSNGNSSN